MERNVEAPVEAELLSSLQWGSTKRLRCVRLRQVSSSNNNNNQLSSSSRIRRKITSRFLTLPHPTRNSETAATSGAEIHKSSYSPERYYSTRGGLEENGKINRVDVVAGKLGENHNSNNDNNNKNGISGIGNKKLVWPKLSIGLSSKEKEEDFMAMKGCKLPQRPKKRAKVVQRTLLLVSPGAWLTDMCWERYEVREKKTGSTSTKKRGRGGLKAMGGCVDSDSD